MIQHSPDHLLARTELFAAVVASGGNKKFVSLPARWFESEAFDDDPEEWARTTGATWGEVNAPRSATGQILEKWD